MLVLNETISEFKLGNNLFNIDENISLALCELNEEYNCIMERTNVVLEYGVIHEGVIISIIKALINFFKKVLETLLSIFTGGSSGSGGGSSGGGGGGSRSSSSSSNKPKEIKVKHPDFKNYNRNVVINELTRLMDYLKDIARGVDALKNDPSRENIIKIINDIIGEHISISNDEFEEFIKNKDKVEDVIDNYMNEIITNILKGYGIPISNNEMNIDELKNAVFDFMIGDMEEFTYSTSNILKIKSEITADKGAWDKSEGIIKLFKETSRTITNSLEKLDQSLSTSNDNTTKLISAVIQIFIKAIKKDCDILIVLSNTVVSVIGTHINYHKYIVEELEKA